MQKPLTGKHVLIILLTAFGIVFAVNGYFLYSAIHTHSGEQRGATYEAGLHYNATLAEQRAQDELHWSHKSEALPGSLFAVTVADATGSPVAGLSVEGWLERPAAKGTDRKMTFKEVDAGRYEAARRIAGRGNLDFVVHSAEAPPWHHACDLPRKRAAVGRTGALIEAARAARTVEQAARQDRLGGTYPALLCRLVSQRGNKIQWLLVPRSFAARKRSHEFLGRTYSPHHGLHNVLPVRAAMRRTGRIWVSKQYVADVCGHGPYPCRPMVAVDQGSMEGQANQPIGHVLSA